jgi:superfamily II DNA or RNA helicase
MSFTTICFDEAHHISERVIEVLETIDRKYNVLLSATITRSKKQELQLAFPNLFTYSIKLKEAIDNNVLPAPLVYLIPYYLDNTNRDILLTLKSSKKGKGVICDYTDRWKYLKDKSYTTIIVKCTQLEAISELSNKIEYLKRMYIRSHNEAFKNKWLQMAGQRLKMLGNFKTSIVLNLQVLFKNQRCLTFCNSIEQTEQLGRYCINSNNKDSLKLIDKFNEGKINHITSCNMLSEGVNLVNCRIGIFASLDSSEILIAQKNGRLLRHESPVLIIPYYKNTREEEIVSKMLEDYNPELVTVVESLNQIKV